MDHTMTSGQFHSLPVGSIFVNREGRQRDTIDDIEGLADSISRLGLIQPIVVTRENVLVAGERRLAACRTLGHTHIACQYTDEVDQHTLHAIELEENIKRKNLEWQEECNAVLQYSELRKLQDPNIKLEEIAEAIGLPLSTFNHYTKVAKELRTGNKLINDVQKFSTALGILERASERRNEEALLELHRIEGTKKEQVAEPPDSILNVNFLEWAMTYTGPKFNFIHCDFPYGIGADKFNQGSAPTHGGYVDTDETYWDLCNCLIHSVSRLCLDSCHFMFWFSMHNYQRTLDLFDEDSDIRLDPFPLVWVKSDNVGILPDPQRGPRRIYETCLFGSLGDRKIVRPTSNVAYLPTDRSQHMSIKPFSVLTTFFRMFVDSSTLMLDPTCGSGSSLRAAEYLAASHVLGLEINKEFAEGANQAMKLFRMKK